MINPRALHIRLMLLHTMLLGTLALAFAVYTYIGLQHYMVSYLQDGLMRRASQVADDMVLRMPRIGKARMIEDIKAVYAPESNNRFIRITGKDGKLIYVSGIPKDLSFNSTDLGPVTGPFPNQRSEDTVNGGKLYIASTIVSLGKDKDYIIEAGFADTIIRITLQELLITFVLGFPMLLLLAAGGAYLLVQRSLSPVTEIMNAAENISLQNLSNRLPVPSTGDKLEHLSLALNRMITRLHDAFQQATRFTADVSHELRTPLTVMRGELELIFNQSHLPEDVREQIGTVLGETERLTAITEGLLTIARLEAGEAKVGHKAFDLGQLVISTTEQMNLLAQEKNITLNVIDEGNVITEGDPARIKQVVVNLLDNAIKYTPEKGSIMIRAFSRDKKVHITVADTGIGIPEPHLAHIFKRFYRVDKVRSRSFGGSGLGLSIVNSICVAHGGSVSVESITDKGTVFTVTLPKVQLSAQSQIDAA